MSQMQGWINSRSGAEIHPFTQELMDAVVGTVKKMRSRMMIVIVEAFWLRLHAILSVFAEKFATVDPALVRDLGRMANDAFLLLGYLAFRKGAEGDEVAITVDIQSDGLQMTIASDACTDDGRVVAAGPSAAIRLSESERNVETVLDDWLYEFEQFLLRNESAMTTAVSQIT